jgi:transposase
VARKGEAQIARDFGISVSCLQRWLKMADREDGLAPSVAGERSSGAKSESAELRELRRRNKLLEQESEIFRRRTAATRAARRATAAVVLTAVRPAARGATTATQCRSSARECGWQEQARPAGSPAGRTTPSP